MPPGFKNHTYQFTVDLDADPETVWSWLNDPRTFTDNQVWPFKVEFYSPDPDNIRNGFNEGVLTNHTGPFINFAGQLTSIKPDYRDLQYFYGSYALRFNWIRPYRLEFKSENNGNITKLTCTLSSYVKPSIYKMWDTGCRWFWRPFKRWSKKEINKLHQIKQRA